MEAHALPHLDDLTKYIKACGGSQEEWLVFRHLKAVLHDARAADQAIADALRLNLVVKNEYCRDYMRVETRLSLVPKETE